VFSGYFSPQRAILMLALRMRKPTFRYQCTAQLALVSPELIHHPQHQMRQRIPPGQPPAPGRFMNGGPRPGGPPQNGMPPGQPSQLTNGVPAAPFGMHPQMMMPNGTHGMPGSGPSGPPSGAPAGNAPPHPSPQQTHFPPNMPPGAPGPPRPNMPPGSQMPQGARNPTTGMFQSPTIASSPQNPGPLGAGPVGRPMPPPGQNGMPGAPQPPPGAFPQHQNSRPNTPGGGGPKPGQTVPSPSMQPRPTQQQMQAMDQELLRIQPHTFAQFKREMGIEKPDGALTFEDKVMALT
jgi:hypothetical protein